LEITLNYLLPTPTNTTISFQLNKILQKMRIFTAIKTSVVVFWAVTSCRDHSEDLAIKGRIILKWILGKQGWRVLIGFIWLRIGTGGGIL
jgi:hypothetical protein